MDKAEKVKHTIEQLEDVLKSLDELGFPDEVDCIDRIKDVICLEFGLDLDKSPHVSSTTELSSSSSSSSGGKLNPIQQKVQKRLDEKCAVLAKQLKIKPKEIARIIETNNNSSQYIDMFDQLVTDVKDIFNNEENVSGLEPVIDDLERSLGVQKQDPKMGMGEDFDKFCEKFYCQSLKHFFEYAGKIRAWLEDHKHFLREDDFLELGSVHQTNKDRQENKRLREELRELERDFVVDLKEMHGYGGTTLSKMKNEMTQNNDDISKDVGHILSEVAESERKSQDPHMQRKIDQMTKDVEKEEADAWRQVRAAIKQVYRAQKKRHDLDTEVAVHKALSSPHIEEVPNSPHPMSTSMTTDTPHGPITHGGSPALGGHSVGSYLQNLKLLSDFADRRKSCVNSIISAEKGLIKFYADYQDRILSEIDRMRMALLGIYFYMCSEELHILCAKEATIKCRFKSFPPDMYGEKETLTKIQTIKRQICDDGLDEACELLGWPHPLDYRIVQQKYIKEYNRNNRLKIGLGNKQLNGVPRKYASGSTAVRKTFSYQKSESSGNSYASSSRRSPHSPSRSPSNKGDSYRMSTKAETTEKILDSTHRSQHHHHSSRHAEYKSHT